MPVPLLPKDLIFDPIPSASLFLVTRPVCLAGPLRGPVIEFGLRMKSQKESAAESIRFPLPLGEVAQVLKPLKTSAAKDKSRSRVLALHKHLVAVFLILL